ncbi:PDZ domain-containing protein [Leptolyngbya sp. FACHB-261]|nr:PDZ domain-containing protein [Leptolyngbya sp. FACHB-261]
MRAGDIIEQINDQPVTDTDAAQKQVQASSIGSNLTLQLRRNGQELKINARIGNFPTQPAIQEQENSAN